MSTREESYSGYPLWIVPLTGGDAPEPDGHPNAVRIYADENQDLRTIKSDGTDAPIGGGGAGVIFQATITLTNDQILALPTTALELVAAPGSDKMLVPIHAVLSLKWTADYTNIDQTANLSADVGIEELAWLGFLDQSKGSVGSLLANGGSYTSVLGPYQVVGAGNTLGNTSDVRANLADSPIYVQAYNASAGDFTGGDPANTLFVSVLYYTLTLP